MNKRSFAIGLYGFIFFVLAACGSSNPPSKPIETKSANKEKGHDSHDHDHHEHGHNCHQHEAPNGGVLAELGREYAHLEFVVDASNNKIICYVLDGDLKAGVKALQPTIIAQIKGLDDSQQIVFTASVNELANNTENSSSQYSADYKLEADKSVTLIIKKIILKGVSFENIEVKLQAKK